MQRKDAIAAIAGAMTALSARRAFAADTVRVGMVKLPSALFAGIGEGYFADAGIDVQPQFSLSEPDLLTALAAGKVDVAIVAPGAGFFNALAQSVKATIVADTWTAVKDAPSGDAAFIVVRKDLVPYGKFEPRDAKGMTFAVTGHGEMTEFFAVRYLAAARLTFADAGVVEMPLPDMKAALQNHAIDIASTVEPYATMLAADNTGVKQAGVSSVMPGSPQGVMMYGPRLAKTDRGLGLRFMSAFAKANTFVRAQLATPAGRATLTPLYQKYLALNDEAIYQQMGFPTGLAKLAVDLDGKYGLRWQLQQFVSQGLVTSAPDLERWVDPSFTRSGP